MKSLAFYVLGCNLLLLFLGYRLLLNRFLLQGGRIDPFAFIVEHRGKLLVPGADVGEVCLPTISLKTLVDGIEALADERGRPLHIHEGGLDELRVLVQTVEPGLEVGSTVTLDMLLHAILRRDKGCGKLGNEFFSTVGFATKGLPGLESVQTTFRTRGVAHLVQEVAIERLAINKLRLLGDDNLVAAD